MSTYEGWRNRETWAISLWLNNDEGWYHVTTQAAANLVAEDFDEDDPNGFDTADAVSSFADWIESEITSTIAMAEEAMTTAGEYVTETTLNMIRDIGLTPSNVDWGAIAFPWIVEALTEAVNEALEDRLPQ